ncbi:glutathione peroxidase [Novosphingobium cyanobacteriorum]|uniref:Glutathione peroxidase n=1 Tax=Novosphingobium cyanobacteriorum TaxID=3024215 RepID=A0ABT6CDD9_9SPHN|nr:glutathione peroxidase [Novosphingobium cyanobacteriorum]MDF8331944.1 glutathione peroxidase [Novosphingobium cyanobacteriorum]
MSQPLPDIALTRNDGTPDSLGAHRGRVLLVVNTASQCGLTPQYSGLQALQEKYGPQGFEVLGFPANDFGAQEPGSDDEIRTFCETGFNVSFPLFAKASVVGEGKQPLFAALTEAVPEKRGDPEAFRERLRGYGMTPNPDPEVLWNFEKFVLARDGSVAARFAPTVAPDDADLVATIEAELAKG